MLRSFFILLASAGSVLAGVDFFTEGAKPPPADLLLDEKTQAKSDALGTFAWGVFLSLEGRPLDESHGEHLSAALTNWPESETLLKHLVAPWIQRRDYKGASAILGPIAHKHPDIFHLHLFLGLMQHAAGDRPAAIETFEHIYFKLKGHKPVVLRELAALYWQEQRFAKIEVLLHHAGRTGELRKTFIFDYASALFHNNLARELADDGDREKRIERHTRLAVRHALAAVATFDQRQSLDDCEKLLKILTEHGEFIAGAELLGRAAIRFPRLQIPLLIQQAGLLVKGEREERARHILGAIQPHRITDTERLLHIGHVAIQAGDLQMGRKAFERAFSLAPKTPAIRLPYAMLLLHLGEAEKSLSILEATSHLNPGGWLAKAKALMQLERWGDAINAWQQAATLARTQEREDFETVDYHLLGATLYEKIGLKSESVASARRAVERDPENPFAANFLGYMLADYDQELAAAEKLIKLAVRARPQSDAFLDSLAWLYYRQGRYPEAAEAIARSLRHAEPEVDPVILDHAGDIFHKIGAERLARIYWRRALLANPENPAAIERKLEASPGTANGPSATRAAGGGAEP